jgi:hypothetical protein
MKPKFKEVKIEKKKDPEPPAIVKAKPIAEKKEKAMSGRNLYF